MRGLMFAVVLFIFSSFSWGSEVNTDQYYLVDPDTLLEKAMKEPFQFKHYLYHDMEGYIDYHQLPNELIDHESFRILGDGFAFDKNHLYLEDSSLTKESIEADNKSLAIHYHDYLHTHFCLNYDTTPCHTKKWSEEVTHFFQEIYEDYVDIESFKIIDLSGVSYDKNHVYHKNNYYAKGEYSKVNSADPQSYHLLTRDYGKDDYSVYYQEKDLQLNPEQFTSLTEEVFYMDDQLIVFGKQLDEPIKGELILLKGNNVEPPHKTYLDHFQYYYIKDDAHGYYIDRFNQKLLKLDGEDPDSFEMLNQFYARDKNYAYFQNKSIKWADPETFQALNRVSLYAKDRDRVFMGPHYVAMADAESFKDVGFGYGTDREWVFFEGVRLIHSDGPTFERISGNETGFFRDKNHIYSEGKRLYQAYPDTFEIIEGYWAKDQNNLYYKDHLIPMGDPDTFKMVEEKKHQRIYIDQKNIYQEENFQWSSMWRHQDFMPPYVARLKESSTSIRELKGLAISRNEMSYTPFDTEGFEALDGYYYRTHKGIYFAGVDRGEGPQFIYAKEVKDPESFIELTDGYGIDRHNLYNARNGSAITIMGSLEEYGIDYEAVIKERQED